MANADGTAEANDPAGVKRVSMVDVGRLANVSQKTVSRVVNGEPHVRPDVERRVRDAIAQLGFRPNAAARALVNRSSHRIGVVSIGSMLQGPMSALAGLERAIREAGYTLSLVRTSEHTSEKIQEAITRLVDDGVDGIALSEPTDTMDASIFIPPGIPLLTIASPEAHHSAEALVIGADQAGGAQSATEHLLALGHRTVWHISGPALWAPTRQRILGWRQALLEAEAPEPPIVEGDWTPASGFAAGVLLAERKEVTAIFAGNDHMAIGAIHAIERVGLRVPQDISVVGYDDAPESEYLSVPLTTVRQDMEEVARQGIHRLIRVIEGAPLAQRHKTLAVQLMVRSSTAPPDPRRTALTLA